MDSLSIAQKSERCPSRLGTVLRHGLADHAWLLAYCLVYMVAVVAVLESSGQPHRFLMLSYAVSTLVPPLLAVLFIAFGHLCHHGLHVRPCSPRGIFRAILSDERLTLRRAAYAAIPVVLIPVFASVFTSFKNAIPGLIPFSYDRDFMLLDRMLHLGNDPWRLLQPLLGHPLITSCISYLYNLWLPLMYLILYWQIFSIGKPRLRMQYLLSFALIWSLGGSLLALVLSSAGPVYFSEVTDGASPYAALMTYLQQADQHFKNWSLEAQVHLWDNYSTGQVTPGGGISAMPSLHVAIALLQALLGWRTNAKLGLCLSLYAAVVLIGSIHLGWHYAVDGYVSIALTIFVWLAVGWFLERRMAPARAWGKRPLAGAEAASESPGA